MKKKNIRAAFLLFLTLFALLPVPSFAASDTLTVQTRSGNYKFRVGDTFTYNYWLSIDPTDLVNLGYSDSTILTALNSAKLKDVTGGIMYDADHLEVVETSLPKFHNSLTFDKNVLNGTIITNLFNKYFSGTVLDLIKGDLFFKALFINDEESAVFQQKNILISVKFKVKAGNDTPVYLRTKLGQLDVTYTVGSLSKTISFIDDKNSIDIVPFASYETIDNAQPSTLLNSYVSDQGFDIRCVRTPDSTEQYIRPGAGVAVTFNGVSAEVEHTVLTQYTTGEDVYWFYDIPYGEYFVSCSYTAPNGTQYDTPDLSHSEYVSIPSTGIVQALWLFENNPVSLTQLSRYVSHIDRDTTPPQEADANEDGAYTAVDMTLVAQDLIL